MDSVFKVKSGSYEIIAFLYGMCKTAVIMLFWILLSFFNIFLFNGHSNSFQDISKTFLSQLSSDKKFTQNRSHSEKKDLASKVEKQALPVKETPALSAKLAPGSCTKELMIQGVIGSATLDSLQKAIAFTEKDGCSSLLLLINTPGGLVLSTRKIVEAILDSKVPILCLVYPSGAHAGSAGAIILQACHVNGAVEATNIGAATPILSTGGETPEDLRKKMVNDATSWLDSLTELRKRNKKFGRDIITDAKAVSGQEAYKIGAIDFFGSNKEEFLKFAHGKKVQVQDKKDQAVQIGALQPIKLGMRHHVISFVTDPQIAYLLFTGSLLLIYFEITHPGMVVPGVLGVTGLILSLTGMHKLNFVWGGLMLMLLGIVFMILEAFTSVGFGVLGLAGAASFVVGSFFLFDPNQTGGVDIPHSTIIMTSLIFVAISLGLAYMAFTTLRKKKDDEEHWMGLSGEIVKVRSDSTGLMQTQGEMWKYHCKSPLQKGDIVEIVSYSGMVFDVQKKSSEGS